MATQHGSRAPRFFFAPTIAILIHVSLAAAPVGAAYHVAVVDYFFPGDQAFVDEKARQTALVAFDAVDIDGDRRRDPLYHGDVVSLLLGGEGVDVVPYPLADPTRPKPEIADRLSQIRDDVGGGVPIDAVLLCWESSTLVSAFGPLLAVGRETACQAVIRSWATTSEAWRETVAVIDALEDLTALGVTVVTIAGNSGVRMVNTYSFARGVITVGDAAPDPDGRWIASNALVDQVEQASFPIRLVCDRERPSFGYDIDGDRLADISLSRVSSYREQRSAPPRESRLVLRGSSFAAPTALRRMLVAIRD